jgi:lysophospholipase L1-like esterase
MPRPLVSPRRFGLFGCVLAVALGARCEVPRSEASRPTTAPGAAPMASSAGAAPEPSTVPAASAVLPDAGMHRRAYAVAALGDSLTDFRSHGGGYLHYLKERCPESRFDSYGKGGDMVNQMRRRFGKDLLGRPDLAYDHLIVFGGVNDLYSDLTALRTVPKIEADLMAIYAAARERGMKVVAVTVTPWGGFSRYYTEARGRTTRELNRWIMERRGAGVVDFAVDAYPLLSCGSPELLCDRLAEPFHDGLHFGPEGHKKLGAALFEAVFSDCR